MWQSKPGAGSLRDAGLALYELLQSTLTWTGKGTLNSSLRNFSTLLCLLFSTLLLQCNSPFHCVSVEKKLTVSLRNSGSSAFSTYHLCVSLLILRLDWHVVTVPYWSWEKLGKKSGNFEIITFEQD